MFKIEFPTSNAAFHDAGPDSMREEISRILRDVADSLEHGNESGALRDANGNRLGSWSIGEA